MKPMVPVSRYTFSGPWLVLCLCMFLVFFTGFRPWVAWGAIALMWLAVAGETVGHYRRRSTREEGREGRIPFFGPCWFAGLAAVMTVTFTRFGPIAERVMLPVWGSAGRSKSFAGSG